MCVCARAPASACSCVLACFNVGGAFYVREIACVPVSVCLRSKIKSHCLWEMMSFSAQQEVMLANS